MNNEQEGKDFMTPEEEKHTPLEFTSEEDRSSVFEEHDLLLDIKYLMKEYYIATFSESGNMLNLKFKNGQKFQIIVNAVK